MRIMATIPPCVTMAMLRAHQGILYLRLFGRHIEQLTDSL